MNDFIEYAGLSYLQASLEGQRLIRQADMTGKWFDIIDRLATLRAIMLREAGQPARIA